MAATDYDDFAKRVNNAINSATRHKRADAGIVLKKFAFADNGALDFSNPEHMALYTLHLHNESSARTSQEKEYVWDVELTEADAERNLRTQGAPAYISHPETFMIKFDPARMCLDAALYTLGCFDPNVAEEQVIVGAPPSMAIYMLRKYIHKYSYQADFACMCAFVVVKCISMPGATMSWEKCHRLVYELHKAFHIEGELLSDEFVNNFTKQQEECIDVRKLVESAKKRWPCDDDWLENLLGKRKGRTVVLDLYVKYLRAFPTLGVWQDIPCHELDAMEEALTLADSDPLAFHPLTRDRQVADRGLENRKWPQIYTIVKRIALKHTYDRSLKYYHWKSDVYFLSAIVEQKTDYAMQLVKSTGQVKQDELASPNDMYSNFKYVLAPFFTSDSPDSASAQNCIGAQAIPKSDRQVKQDELATPNDMYSKFKYVLAPFFTSDSPDSASAQNYIGAQAIPKSDRPTGAQAIPKSYRPRPLPQIPKLQAELIKRQIIADTVKDFASITMVRRPSPPSRPNRHQQYWEHDSASGVEQSWLHDADDADPNDIF